MAENEQAGQAQEQAEAGAPEAKKKKKRKKPNFSKPFILSGILLGIFAGAPYLNLGNYIFGLWGWVFGLLAAWMLSKEYKYFLLAHGGMVGFFAGLIGSGIAMAIDIGLCLANISTFTLVPSLKPALERVANMLSFWIPPQLKSAIILPTWSELEKAYRVFQAGGDPAVAPGKVAAGHAFFMVPLLAGTAILGGIIGWKLFAKAAPKKQLGVPRRKRPAEAGKPEAGKPAPAAPESQPTETPQEAKEQPVQPEAGKPASAAPESQPAQTPQEAKEQPVQPEAAPEKTPEQPGSFEYKSELSDSPKEEQEKPEGGQEKEE